MLKQLILVVCLLLVFQQAVGNKELRSAPQEFVRPDLVGYINKNCVAELAALDTSGHNDGATTAEVIQAYASSGIDQWRDRLETQVNNCLNGGDFLLSDVQADYKSVVCSIGILNEMGNRQMAGIPQVDDIEDVAVLNRLLLETVSTTNGIMIDMAGATDFDHAAGDLVRILFSLDRMQQLLFQLKTIYSENSMQKRVTITDLMQFIDENCQPVENIIGELTDNTPLTTDDIKDTVTGSLNGWLTTLSTGVADSSTDLVWVEGQYKQVVCSIGQLYALVNHMTEGGEAEVCEGQEIDNSDIEAVAQCLAQNLADMDELDAELHAMDENTNAEDASVVIVNMLTTMGRIQHGLWLIAEDEGGEV